MEFTEYVAYGFLALCVMIIIFVALKIRPLLREIRELKKRQSSALCKENCQNTSECAGLQGGICFLDTIDEDSALDPKEKE